METMSNWLIRNTSCKRLLFFGVAFLLCIFFLLPYLKTIIAVASDGAGSPDLRLYYTSSELYALMSKYSQAGRFDYIKTRFTIDLLWPIIYVSFLAVAISYFYKYQLSSNAILKSRRANLNLLPLAAGIFDLSENITVSINMYFYPMHVMGVDWIAGICTFLKWVFVSMSLLAFIREGYGTAMIRLKRRR